MSQVTLNQDGRLVSSFSKTNYSRGRFLFTLQTDGNLVSYTRNFPMEDASFAYWSTQTMDGGFQMIFNQSGYIFLVTKNGSVLNFMASNAVSTSQFYQRAILEYDGVLRHYVYPKYPLSEGGRTIAWSTMDFIPSNIYTCITQSTGSGACGFNSFCSLGTDQMPNCDCPVDYSVIDPNDRMSGCKPNFAPQNCDEEARETDLFSFTAMPNTDWPLSDYAYFHQVIEEWCRQWHLEANPNTAHSSGSKKDESFIAKISDFGIAKLLKPDQSRTTTGIRGTKGYVAPEWFINMLITVKVDVYNFGILLLELICCRRNYEPDVEVEPEMILADFAYDCYNEGTFHLLVANDKKALNNKRFDKFVKLAIWCIQEDPALRPTMERVVQFMERSVQDNLHDLRN
ncbi:receptor-like protein kinase 1 [Forsythia ovata]|uniref:Receptor-like protein kinase 1 n=1 Tax=Forsythia ovata TaxID=205694 RepID=A0ABD1T5I7_9LAMI